MMEEIVNECAICVEPFFSQVSQDGTKDELLSALALLLKLLQNDNNTEMDLDLKMDGFALTCSNCSELILELTKLHNLLLETQASIDNNLKSIRGKLATSEKHKVQDKTVGSNIREALLEAVGKENSNNLLPDIRDSPTFEENRRSPLPYIYVLNEHVDIKLETCEDFDFETIETKEEELEEWKPTEEYFDNDFSTDPITLTAGVTNNKRRKSINNRAKQGCKRRKIADPEFYDVSFTTDDASVSRTIRIYNARNATRIASNTRHIADTNEPIVVLEDFSKLLPPSVSVQECKFTVKIKDSPVNQDPNLITTRSGRKVSQMVMKEEQVSEEESNSNWANEENSSQDSDESGNSLTKSTKGIGRKYKKKSDYWEKRAQSRKIPIANKIVHTSPRILNKYTKKSDYWEKRSQSRKRKTSENQLWCNFTKGKRKISSAGEPVRFPTIPLSKRSRMAYATHKIVMNMNNGKMYFIGKEIVKMEKEFNCCFIGCGFKISKSNEEMEDLQQLLDHFTTSHHDEIKNSKTRRNIHQCNYCTAPKMTMRKLQKHLKLEHPNIRRPITNLCEVCGKPYRYVVSLKAHIWSHLSEEEVTQKIASGEKDPRITIEKGRLTQFKPSQCEICGKEFNSTAKLNQHSIVHKASEDLRKYVCEYCGKVYTRRNSHTIHIARVHESEKVNWQICKICDTKFYSKSRLQLHMTSHGGERKYKCPIEGCDKDFARVAALKKHKMSHADPNYKPFACEFCPMSYRYRNGLRRHALSAHKDKVPEKKSVEEIPVSTCKQMFPCWNCNLFFELPSRRKKHLITVHRIEVPGELSQKQIEELTLQKIDESKKPRFKKTGRLKKSNMKSKQEETDEESNSSESFS